MNSYRTALFALAAAVLWLLPGALAGEDATLRPKDDGYRGIWFTLGQYSDAPQAQRGGKGFWEYGDKYSGGLGTYTAMHAPIAIYAPKVKKTFFCYGGSKGGERYLYNMISYYDTGPIWVDADGAWRIAGPTERGPQRWGTGGEVAVWLSRNQGQTWKKVRDVTKNSPRNHSYVRNVVGAEPDSPFFMLWADGHADKLSISRLYFADRDGAAVRRLPYDMKADFATPERYVSPEEGAPRP